jgi:hypothetical protein
MLKKQLVLQNHPKAFALVRERQFRALVLQNGLRPRSSARTSISRTTMQSRNIILKVVSSKKWLMKSLEIFNWEVGSLSCVVAFVDTIICVDLK